MKTPGIVFFPEEKSCELRGEDSLLDVALNNKLEIGHSCGGMGSCGTCRVIVLEGLELLNPRNEVEQEIADTRGFQPNERLACQTQPPAQGKFLIPKRSK